LKEKSEALLHYQTYHNRITNQHKKGIVILRVDGGGEFNSTAFLEFLNKTGTKLERTMPHSFQENPCSERINRTIMDIARCLLHYAGAPKTFWREAVKMAVYVHNRTPTKALHTQTPYEIWFGRKPDLSNLRVFGCTAYAILPETQRHKLSDRAIKCVFLGYLDTSSGYFLYNIADHSFIKSRDVRFNEEEFPFHGIDRSDPLFDYEPEDTSDGSYRETREVDQISRRRLQVEERENRNLSYSAHYTTSSSSKAPCTGFSTNTADLPLTSPGSSGDGQEVSNTTDSQPETGTRRSKRTRTQRYLGPYIDSNTLAIHSLAERSSQTSDKIPIPRSITEARYSP